MRRSCGTRMLWNAPGSTANFASGGEFAVFDAVAKNSIKERKKAKANDASRDLLLAVHQEPFAVALLANRELALHAAPP